MLLYGHRLPICGISVIISEEEKISIEMQNHIIRI